MFRQIQDYVGLILKTYHWRRLVTCFAKLLRGADAADPLGVERESPCAGRVPSNCSTAPPFIAIAHLHKSLVLYLFPLSFVFLYKKSDGAVEQ